MILTLERLENNDLPLPKYETPQAAALDFAACLTRPCKIVEPNTGKKTEFMQDIDSTGRVKPGTTLNQGQKSLWIIPNETIMVSLGWKCSFGTAVYLQLHVRSSVGLKGVVLANSTGIVDPDYRGELFGVLHNRSTVPIEIHHGERIVQGVLTYFTQASVEEGKVGETERKGGFGSTGRGISDSVELEVKKV